MVTVRQPTAGLLPDPVAICTHINRLTEELKIARRLLRLSLDAHGTSPVSVEKPAAQQPEAAHAPAR